MGKIDTSSMYHAISVFQQWAPSKNQNKNAPCTVKELNNAVMRISDMMQTIVKELENAE